MNGLYTELGQIFYPDKDRLNEVTFSSTIVSVAVFATVISLLRHLFERHIASNLAKLLRIQDRRKLPGENPQLEDYYKNESRNPDEGRIIEICRETKMDARQVDVWFRRRRNLDRPSKEKKFKETLWRLVYYVMLVAVAVVTLKDAAWFRDTDECWTNFGRQEKFVSVHVYYHLEAGFYVSLLLSVCTDVRRKDFLEMVVHHFVTLLLLAYSHLCSIERIGTLIMAVHDVSDVFLELAKTLHYAGKNRIAEHMFTLFAVVFMATRWVVFPFWLIASTVRHLTVQYYQCVGFLMALQVLHLFWGAIIIRMAVKMVRDGQVAKDDRSDVDEETGEEEEEEKGEGEKKED